MIWVFFILFVAMIVIGTIMCDKCYDAGEFIGGCMAIIGGLMVAVVLLTVIVGTIYISDESVLDERIELHEAENHEIENRVQTIVWGYMDHEYMVYDDIAPEDAIAFVAGYPELKSDALIQSQIDIYVTNNHEIRALKDKQLSINIWKWWLYFGGK